MDRRALQRSIVDHRTEINRKRRWIPDSKTPGPLRDTFDKGVMD
jgi:hypothetical protein